MISNYQKDNKKTPHLRGFFIALNPAFLRFKLIASMFLSAYFFLIFTGGFVNVFEKKEEAPAAISCVVSSIQNDYIALVYNSEVKGVEQEIGFARRPDVELIYKSRWDQIKRGERVIAKFIEIRRVREGRSDTGEFRRESTVLERHLVSLEFEEGKNRQLISGV